MQLMSIVDGDLFLDSKKRTFQNQAELMRDMRDQPQDYEGFKWTLHEPRPIFEVKSAQLYTVLKGE